MPGTLLSILATKADLVDGKVKTDQMPTSSNGKSAYEVAVDNGFAGTEQEWLLSLIGETGAPGTPGQNGTDATVTKSSVESILTGEISSHTHAGGSGGLTQQQIEGFI